MSSISSKISRRALMKAFGATAATLPFYRLLEHSAVEAQGMAPPLRFLCIYVPDGYAYEYFRPRAPGNDTPGSGGETDFNLKFPMSVLEPLDPLRDKILILDALDFACAVEDLGVGHNALGTMLTGTPNIRGGGNHNGPSMDQYLSTRIGDVAVPKINACVGDNYDWQIMNQFVFADNGAWVSEQLDPRVVYDIAFGGFTAPSSMSTATAAAPAMSKLDLRKRSKLDFIMGDIQRLKARVGAQEATKLDVHLESIRSIERRLGTITSQVALGCTKPAKPTINKDYLTRKDGLGPDPGDVPMLTDMHADLIAQAFACDRTRVATLRIGQSQGLSMPYLPGDFEGDNHNRWQHNQMSMRGTWTYDAISQGLATMQRAHYDHVAYALNALNNIQEGDGTVLDNTFVMIASEMGNTAAHNSSDLTFILAGGGGKLRTGRYLKLKPDNGGGAIAHNKLLVSVLHAFGIDEETFGVPDFKGELSGLS